MATSIKLGFVPEHFSTPIHYAQIKKFFDDSAIKVELIEYPSGSGHLIQSLKNKEIDYAIGLTEAFVRGICNGDDKYQILGTYVESPLCWSISTGANRDELTSKDQLKGKKIGVSRIGSGSYVMSFVLGLQSDFPEPFFQDFVVLDNFKNLRDSVNLKEGTETSDAFMWEYFTTKKYYDNKEVKKIGEIYTPWPSWVIVGSVDNDKKVDTALLSGLQAGIDYFNANPEESVKFINDNLDYSLEDAKEWLKSVKFSKDVSKLDYQKSIANTTSVLTKANVVTESADILNERLRKFVVQKQ
ncbi:unnamed protein product [Ambrosiozyma monospora]|uniref:Unnamed protein product n=1 Tax=Ambrosiozyma monospora TaxID=43982 RepID=A0A9W6YZ96_AMBMO|nr:unnamed protein product [Ambrosiozyma monospora]